MRPVRVIAHRGAGAGFVDPEGPPENTLPAFEAGWAAGANACELDVQLTADGQVVAIHDATTRRTTGQSWTVAERTAEELLRLDAGSWKHPRWAGTRLPLLPEVLARVPEGRGLVIELKAGPQIVPAAAEAIRASGKGASQLVLVSFDLDTITAAKEALPELECQLVVTFDYDEEAGWNVSYNEGPAFREVTEPYDPERLLGRIRERHLDGIDASFLMPPSFVSTMHDAALKVVTWTVNNPETALELVEHGVYDLTTDRPAGIRDALLAAGVRLA